MKEVKDMIKKLLQVVLIVITLCTIVSCKEEERSSQSSLDTSWSNYPSRPWTAITPAGINIVTDKSTIDQYEVLWSGAFHWEEIDWEALDKEFEFYKQYYCYQLNWDCKYVIPSDLTVYIKSWDGRCKDEETPDQPQEICEYINGKWQCIDGWYWAQVIYFHLGDDPGINYTRISDDSLSSITYTAFQNSAYPHELLHFFQAMSGLPLIDAVYSPLTISGYTIILPHMEIDEEDEIL